MTPQKRAQLRAEAQRDCFSTESFQLAVPPLDPDQPRDLPCAPKNAFDRFVMWNQIALDTTAIDHAPPPPGSTTNSALHNLGPHRASRAMAIVHVALYDAINVATRFNYLDPQKPIFLFQTYSGGLADLKRPVSLDTVITYAGGEVLKLLYPEQAAAIAAFVDQDEQTILQGRNRNDAFFREARDLGRAAARAIFNGRKTDGSAHPEPEVGQPGFPLQDGPGQWRPDPVSNVITALGGRWSEVKPFVLRNASLFRPPPPPSAQEPRYRQDFDEVKRLGGADGTRSPATERTPEQTEIGVFWAYDGTAFLCAPPRLYNQIIRKLVQDKTEGVRGQQDPKLLNYARLFAMANLAMADAAISAWDAKYHFRYWRPVTGIRAAGTDGNLNTEPDLFWKALGAPASNSLRGPNFTPPFPAYPSGHATFGGALFEVLRSYLPEDTAFKFVSDEYNGLNKPVGSDTPRPKIERSFTTLRQAEDENARSRIYLGVHWQFDADAGIAQGNQVGGFVLGNTLRCLTESGAPVDCRLDANRFLLSTEPRTLTTPNSGPRS